MGSASFGIAATAISTRANFWTLAGVVRRVCVSVAACAVMATAASASGPEVGEPALESWHVNSARPALCRTLVALSADASVAFADCGMGRHCEDGTRCCVTSETFWCCPQAMACDYDRPQECKARP